MWREQEKIEETVWEGREGNKVEEEEKMRCGYRRCKVWGKI